MATQQDIPLEFKNPPPINQNQYYDFKSQILSNPHVEILLEDKLFSERLQGYFIKIGIGLIGDVAFLMIAHEYFSKWVALAVTILISLTVVMGAVHLYFELSLYAKYKTKRRDYFAQMKSAIQHTEDYDNFVKLFYATTN